MNCLDNYDYMFFLKINLFRFQKPKFKKFELNLKNSI
jgi:hypothetical protein